VEFAEAGDAKDALENMDNSELYGRVIRVNLAKPQMNKKKAVWEEAEAWLQTLKDAEELEAGGAGAGAPGDDADLRPAATS
jgi:peptidyl-prolyl isomerase E (cyclophilin E)